MKLRAWFDGLDGRERKLLVVFLSTLGALVLVGGPLGAASLAAAQRDDNAGLSEVIAEIGASESSLTRLDQARASLQQRYAQPAPPLAAFLAQHAKSVGLEVPESQDRPPVPVGSSKRYEERSTRLQLHKVGMLALASFLEKVEQSHLPVVVSRLNIRKRMSEPDSYDAEVVVSAYDRKELPKPSTDKPAAGTDAPTGVTP